MAIAGISRQVTLEDKRDVDLHKALYYCQAQHGRDKVIYDVKTNSCVFFGNMDYPIKEGKIVLLRPDVLARHSSSVPPQMGFTTAQFQWRDTLRKLEGKRGTVTRVFNNSKHVNVDFGTDLIGIDHTELVVLTD